MQTDSTTEMDHDYVVEYRRLSREMEESVHHQSEDEISTDLQQVVSETSHGSSACFLPKRDVTLKRLIRVFPVVRKPNIAAGRQEKLSTTGHSVEAESAQKISGYINYEPTSVAVRNKLQGMKSSKVHPNVQPSISTTHTGKQFHLCIVCNKAFTTKETLEEHIEAAHKGECSCTVCNKSFRTDSLLRTHHLDHCEHDPPACAFCKKQFRTVSNLKRHLATVIHETGLKKIGHNECKECGKVLANKHTLADHMTIHSGLKPYQCSVCGKKFAIKRAMTAHLQCHKLDRRYQCSECGKAFKTSGNFRQHALQHKQKAFRCAKCGKEFTWRADLKKHSWVHVEQKPFECTLCGKGFIRRLYLKTHLSRRHPEYKVSDNEIYKQRQRVPSPESQISEAPAVESPIVEYEITRPTDATVSVPSLVAPPLNEPTDPQVQLTRFPDGTFAIIISSKPKHESKPQKEEEADGEDEGFQDVLAESPPPDLKEGMCLSFEKEPSAKSNESKETKSDLGGSPQAVVTHTGKKFHLCNACNKAFTTEELLEKHLFSKHAARRQYKCSKCQRAFILREVFEKHVQKGLCGGAKPGNETKLCTYCGKTFKQKRHLNDHLLTHTGEKPHQCTVCGKCFARKNHLKEHSRIHTGERPYQCAECGKNFRKRSHLNQHMLVHTGYPDPTGVPPKTHQCDKCNLRFSRKTYLDQHLMQHTEQGGFPCDICGKVFKWKYDLRTHVSDHIDGKPYACAVCGDSFKRKSYLIRHSKRLSHVQAGASTVLI